MFGKINVRAMQIKQEDLTIGSTLTHDSGSSLYTSLCLVPTVASFEQHYKA